MTKYHEILHLQSLGFSERNIAQSYNLMVPDTFKHFEIYTVYVNLMVI